MKHTHISIDKENFTRFKSLKVRDIEVFYREAGSPEAPVILLLHGFPSSSHMYRNIMDHLSGSYRVIAPDYPGFGSSSCPPPEEFEYTFDHIARLMEEFIDLLGLTKFSLYMQDYGGPVGFRIAARRPELIQSLIIQNANAYLEGLGPQVQKMKHLESTGNTEGLKEAVNYMLSYEGLKAQYLEGAEDPERISPDAWLSDHCYLERPGKKEIQAVLFADYGSNFPLYPVWQAYLKKYQPPALILWGKNDTIFTVPGAEAYARDIADHELHILNGGHFALEEHHLTIAKLVCDFLDKKVNR